MEAQARLEVQAGQAPRPGSSVSFEQAAQHFLKWCEAVEYARRRNTAQRIITSFASLRAHFGSTPVHLIGVAAVEAYKAHRLTVQLVQPVTVRNDLNALSVFFARYAMPHGWAKQNPVSAVRRPSAVEAQREHVLTEEEERKYFAAAANNQALYDLARLMLNQGCRPDELLSARVEHVDLKRCTLQIAGGKSRAARRLLPLTSESLSLLKRRIGDRKDGWLFPSPRNDRPGQHQTKLNNAHDKACLAAGVSFVLYDLRHTFATRYAAADPNPHTLAKIMGWSTVTMASRYIHVQADTMAAGMKAFEKAVTAKRPRANRKAS